MINETNDFQFTKLTNMKKHMLIQTALWIIFRSILEM